MDTELEEIFPLKTYLIVECTASIIAFLLNATVISIFLCMTLHNRHKRSNLIFLWQSFTDLVVTIAMIMDGIFFFAFYKTILMSPHFYSCWWFFFGYSQFLAVNTLLCITIERFVAIRYPMFHRSNTTKKRDTGVLFILYLFSSVPAVIYVLKIWPLFISEYKRYHVLSMNYVITMGALSMIIIALVFIFLYVCYATIRSSIIQRIKQNSFRVAARSINSRQAKNCPNKSSNRPIQSKYRSTESGKYPINMINPMQRIVTREEKKHKRVIVILLSLCCIYSFTFLPLTGYRICYYPLYNKINDSLHTLLYNSFVLLYFSSALWNPLITLLFNGDYRKVLFHYVVKKYFMRREHVSSSSRYSVEVGSLLGRKSMRETNI